MRVNELRVGNEILHVSHGVKIPKVITCVLFLTAIDMDPDDYTGIPLTEERLLKFGFEKVGANGGFKLGEFYIHFNVNESMVFVYYDTTFNRYIELSTVHVLQNLYFALTGVELQTAKQ